MSIFDKIYAEFSPIKALGMHSRSTEIQNNHYQAKRIHETKKGPGRSQGMKRKNLTAGSKLQRKFAAKINTHMCRTRHNPK